MDLKGDCLPAGEAEARRVRWGNDQLRTVGLVRFVDSRGDGNHVSRFYGVVGKQLLEALQAALSDRLLS